MKESRLNETIAPTVPAEPISVTEGTDPHAPDAPDRGAFPELVGRGPAMQALFAEMARVVDSEVSVHLFGETGTGKERVAVAIHRRSRRGRGPFVAINASSLSDELFETEMFGHAKGAFTGAVSAREGYVARAEAGTLFIDEVADLTARGQAKLLRFVQEKEYRRVGEPEIRHANVRVLSAANVDLERRVAGGLFREDLMYRLRPIVLALPPLRERGGDVRLLARHFLRLAAEREALPPPLLPADVVRALVSYAWPGNIRELENEISRLVVLAGRGPILLEHLSRRVAEAAAPDVRSCLRDARQRFEREFVGRALSRNGGNRTRTAMELGLTRQALVSKIRRLGL
jgi:DNA-binding NtrC family response regulator